MAELMLTAALTRTESCTSYVRVEYPSRGDKNWLKWIVFGRKEDGKLSLKTEPLPLDGYKFKPSRYYMDNFKIPN